MKTDTRQIVELIGIFGVIASLIFVGMQLMLDRDIAIGEQFHNRAEQRLENLRAGLNSESYISAIVKDIESGIYPYYWDEEFNKIVEKDFVAARGYTYEEIVVLAELAQLSATQIDSLAFQYEQGLVPEETWQQFATGLSILLAGPINRAVFTKAPFPLTVTMRNAIRNATEARP